MTILLHSGRIVKLDQQGELLAARVTGGEAPEHHGGGKRGKITHFTRASRLRSKVFVSRFDSSTSGLFVTLTYPSDFPSCVDAKADLRALLRRLGRTFPDCAAFWRMSLQERGAPHFHLLVYGTAFFDERSLRTWWADVVKYEAPDWAHRLRVDVRRIVGRRDFQYVTRYCTKDEGIGEGEISPAEGLAEGGFFVSGSADCDGSSSPSDGLAPVSGGLLASAGLDVGAGGASDGSRARSSDGGCDTGNGSAVASESVVPLDHVAYLSVGDSPGRWWGWFNRAGLPWAVQRVMALPMGPWFYGFRRAARHVWARVGSLRYCGFKLFREGSGSWFDLAWCLYFSAPVWVRGDSG